MLLGYAADEVRRARIVASPAGAALLPLHGGSTVFAGDTEL